MPLDFEELYIEGVPTGHIRFTDKNCHIKAISNKKSKMLFKAHEKQNKYKKQAFSRHVEKHTKGAKKDSDQATIKTISSKTISQTFINKMQQKSIELICNDRLNLNHFEGESMLEYTQEIFSHAGLDPEDASKILPSSRTISRVINKKAAQTEEIIK